MKYLVVPAILCALSAGQVLYVPSSYKDGVKWEFNTNVDRYYLPATLSARSNVVDTVPAVPTVYKKELVVPIARRDPVITTVYKKPSVVPDVYKKPVVQTVYKNEPVVHNVRKHQLVIPPVFKVHSNIYKSVPVVQNVYKQQDAVPIVHQTYPAVSNVHQFKSQLVEPVVHHQEPLLPHDFVLPG